MQQEEERVCAEGERLEQLRAAKVRIDFERAEAAREAEELHERKAREERLRGEATKAAAVERVRLEAIAKAAADERIAEVDARVRVAMASVSAVITPRPSRVPSFASGVIAGLTVAMLVASGWWVQFGSPQQARQDQHLRDITADLDRARADSLRDRSRDRDMIAQGEQTITALRADNQRLQTALDATRSKPQPVRAIATPVQATKKPTCTNPHDPLCGDLDAR